MFSVARRVTPCDGSGSRKAAKKRPAIKPNATAPATNIVGERCATYSTSETNPLQLRERIASATVSICRAVELIYCAAAWFCDLSYECPAARTASAMP